MIASSRARGARGDPGGVARTGRRARGEKKSAERRDGASARTARGAPPRRRAC